MGISKFLQRKNPLQKNRSTSTLTDSVASADGESQQPQERSDAYEVALGYMMAQKACEFIEAGKRFCSPNLVIEFVGSEDDGQSNTEMPGDQFHSCVTDVIAAFPDFTVVWDSITELKPGLVRVRGLTVHGTHTGKPYAFGPYPEISATGKRVHDPIQEALIYVDQETLKVVRFRVNSFGKPSGPANFYTSIGGLLM